MSDSENEIHEQEQEQEHEELVEEDEEVQEAVDEDEEEGEQEHIEEASENHGVEGVDAVESDDEEFAGFAKEEIKQTKKLAKRKVLSDDEEEEGEGEEVVEEEEEVDEEAAAAGVNEEEEQEEMVEEEVVEDEEQQSVEQQEEEDEEEHHSSKKKKSEKKSDLEEAIEKHKNKKKTRRKNDDGETLTNIDNTVAFLVTEMKNAAAEDRAANEKSICSIRKLKMIDVVTNMLQKGEHHATMIELGMLSAMAEWLAPLPDRSLPNIRIREILINALQDFGEINTDYLKSSGIGKAVMFLYKHPKETKPNKEKLEKLVHDWSRPIFNLDKHFNQLTKEERLDRDKNHVKSAQRRTSNEEATNEVDIDDAFDDRYTQKSSKKPRMASSSSKDIEDTGSNRPLRPGDVGFCPRARVPLPSQKDYINRPKSNVDNLEMQEKTKSKKTESRLDKHKKRCVEIKKQGKTNKAVMMSIEGRKLPL